jgi:hypothetical protein
MLRRYSKLKDEMLYGNMSKEIPAKDKATSKRSVRLPKWGIEGVL